MLSFDILDKMKVGDILELYFGEYPQMTLTCTQVCGFKHYILLGNGLESKIFYENNDPNDKSYLYDIILFIDNVEEYGGITAIKSL